MLTQNNASRAYRVKRAGRHRNGIVQCYLDVVTLFQLQQLAGRLFDVAASDRCQLRVALLMSGHFGYYFYTR